MSRTASVCVPVTADDRFGVTGKARPLLAYDAGQAPPTRGEDSPGVELVSANAQDVLIALREHLGPVLPTGRNGTVRALFQYTRQLLAWLLDFPGEDWEQRWLASGADEAPRSWTMDALAGGVGSQRAHATQGLGLLLLGRVLRPSYSFLLNTHFLSLFTRFPQLHDVADFAQMRALDNYRKAVPRLQLDAESCTIRVLLRTGKRFGQLRADDLLTYADLVQSSGRLRREHLAWELLVQLGPLADEPPTLRAVWTA